MQTDLLREPEKSLHQRARGVGRIHSQTRDGRTRLLSLYQEGCAKIRLPHTHADHLEAVLINTAGGLTGGDHVVWETQVAPGAHLVLTTQACERVYRSLGPAAEVRSRLHVGAGAHLDWLPQETILFEDGNLDRALEVELAEGATLLAIEAVLLGRDAMGEAARRARLADRWRIRRNGRLIHAEATQLSGADLERDGFSTLEGANAFATILSIGPDAERKRDQLRNLFPREARVGISAIGERLVLRAFASGGLALRRLIVPAIAMLTPSGALPRLWSS
jgi:urease accessory protein